ncbi:MAG TPA: nucleotidyl transferase AbiEii/AbiGii toxin family protein [Cyclobacteriaceae bacterium]|nr:nucleotidyl transferase AbiEii/AbiGii toxin family protein [Cytophagales bacterium]HNT49739.1 nucleotidyl transferase AbiEii/AbiGii toxin family protein [Cyclobacteriaceae bacterium]
MLHTGTVKPTTLSILKGLMALPGLENFYLVGGTALSLRYGHRTSIDLDLFADQNFDNHSIIESVCKKFTTFSYRSDDNPIGIFGFIDDVKIDLIRHHYFPRIAPAQVEDGIRFFSDDDIIAMKIMTVLKRAQKKDFWDLAELFKYYSLKYCIDCYDRKYPNNQILISVPMALTYFAEADESEEPVSLKGQTWQSVKQAISKTVNDFLK